MRHSAVLSSCVFPQANAAVSRSRCVCSGSPTLSSERMGCLIYLGEGCSCSRSCARQRESGSFCVVLEASSIPIRPVVVGGRNAHPMGHLPIREPEPFLTRFSESTRAGTDLLRAACPPSFRNSVFHANRTGRRRVTCRAIPVRLASRLSAVNLQST